MSELQRRRVFSGAPWERQVGYCRALRAGPMIFVTGTVAVDEAGRPFEPGDPLAQATRCFEIIERALAQLDAGLRDVVRTRMYVTDIQNWRAVGQAHRAAFEPGREPCATMVEVARLIDDAFLVEIEVDAVLDRSFGG